MAIYRTMAILQGKSNLPEDRFVNTWHFDTGNPGITPAAFYASVNENLHSFYEDPVEVGGFSVSDFLPSDVINSTIQFRHYDLSENEPREPEIYDGVILPSAVAPLPTEVAVCLSFFGTRNIPRQRGRVFIGPLSQNAGTVGAGGAGLRVADALANTLIAAAARLDADLAATGVQWVVWSRTSIDAHPVTGGWVDNAFDTQRRRGTQPTGRAMFGTPSGT